jgi:hypothetical protein
MNRGEVADLMKTDVDTALRDIADWYVKNRRSMTEPELEAILNRHCESDLECDDSGYGYGICLNPDCPHGDVEQGFQLDSEPEELEDEYSLLFAEEELIE